MNTNIMNNPKKGFLKKIWKSDGFQIFATLVIFVLIIYGIVSIILYKDEQDYPYGEYEMTYRVYYSENNVKEYTITHNRPIYMRSSKGSNEIHKHDWGDVIETSAPIEIVRYIKKK